jgi:hypothetical protein
LGPPVSAGGNFYRDSPTKYNCMIAAMIPVAYQDEASNEHVRDFPIYYLPAGAHWHNTVMVLMAENERLGSPVPTD